MTAPLVFILSPPRSGSTLLRVMLGGHPSLFAPPELELLSFETLAERKAALSGRYGSFLEKTALGDRYNFWLEGMVRAIMALRGCDAEEAKRTMEDWEGRQLTTIQCYRLMQSWLGDRILVDKTPSYSFNLETLKRAEVHFDRALYIHLLRHPRAMIRSFEEAKFDQIFVGYEHSLSPRALAESFWLISHQNILEFLKGVPAHRQYRLKYEELVNRPRAAVEGICQFLGLTFHPDMLQPYGDPETRMTDGIHPGSKMVGDPKFHQNQGIDPKAADRWREDSTEDFLADVTWKLAESLCYERTTRSNGGFETPTTTGMTAGIGAAQQFEPASSMVPLGPDGLDEGRL